MLSITSLANFLQGFGIYSVIGSIVISVLVAITTVLPSAFITGANVLVFGPYFGLLVSWLGEVIGALISFYLYRRGLKSKSDQLSDRNKQLKILTQASGTTAGWIVFYSRLMPFVPSGIVTLAASISKISIHTFLIATALGKLPSITLEVLVSYNILSVSRTGQILLIAVIVLVTVVLQNVNRNIVSRIM